MTTRVTIIGGGSYQWGPELMADLFGTPALAGMDLVLQDVNPDPLPKMEALAHKVNDALGAKATIAATTDQRAALEGADFVIVCISTGAFRSMAVDLDVPAKYGITQTVGDSVGPGWDQPRPAQHPRAGGHRPRHGGALPGCLALQHHQPDDDADPIGLPGDEHQGGRASATRSGNFCMDLAIALGVPCRGGAPGGDRRQPLPGASPRWRSTGGTG